MISQNNKIFIIFLVLLFSLLIVSANGLSVGNASIVLVNKTYGNNYNINFTITNKDTFTFYNVSFEVNPYINMTKIPTLIPNETKTIQAIVFTNEEINQIIKIKGFYETNIGDSNRTFPLNVSYDYGITDTNTGLKKCSFTIIKGDTVSWTNSELSSIEIRNSNNNEQVAIIGAGNTFNFKFNTPQTFAYRILKSSFDFTGTCEITVLDTQGFVNNPELDTSIQLITNMSYVPTTIELNILQRDYNINFTTADEGILSIKNTGSAIAKNVNLYARWFTFTSNNFDLNPGQTKSVGYRIYPLPEYTNQTNKTTNITMTVSGNFPPRNEQFNIFVPYAEISYTGSSGGSILDLIIQYCIDHPTDTICKPKVVYVNYDNGTANISIATTKSEFDGMRREVFLLSNLVEEMRKQMTERYDNLSLTNDILLNFSDMNAQRIEKIEEKTSGNDQTMTFWIAMFGTLAVLGLGGWYGYNIWNKKRMAKWENQ